MTSEQAKFINAGGSIDYASALEAGRIDRAQVFRKVFLSCKKMIKPTFGRQYSTQSWLRLTPKIAR